MYSHLKCFRAAAFGRLLGWVIGAAMLGGLSGCTTFQQLSTANFFDGRWTDLYPGAAQPVSKALAFWDHQVHVTQNTARGNVPLPGLAGRLMLFSDGATEGVNADGKVLVQMYDLTTVAPGVAPPIIGQWTFQPDALKRLKKKDYIADGYTLFLPWESYTPEVRKVQLHVFYYPHKGDPIYADPAILTLRNDPQDTPIVQQANTTSVPQAANRK